MAVVAPTVEPIIITTILIWKVNIRNVIKSIKWIDYITKFVNGVIKEMILYIEQYI